MLYNEKNIMLQPYSIKREFENLFFDEFKNKYPILYETMKFDRKIILSKINNEELTIQIFVVYIDNHYPENLDKNIVIKDLPITRQIYDQGDFSIDSLLEVKSINLYDLITENSNINMENTSWYTDDGVIKIKKEYNLYNSLNHYIILQIIDDVTKSKLTPYNFKSRVEKLIKLINDLETITVDQLKVFIIMNLNYFKNDKGTYTISNSGIESFKKLMRIYDPELYDESKIAVDEESSLKRYNFLLNKRSEITEAIGNNSGIPINCLKLSYRPGCRQYELSLRVTNWPDGPLLLTNRNKFLAFERFLYCCKLFTDYTIKIRELILSCA